MMKDSIEEPEAITETVEFEVKIPARLRRNQREMEKTLEFCKKIWGKDIKKRRK